MFTGIVEFSAPVVSILGLKGDAETQPITQLKIGVPSYYRGDTLYESRLPPLSWRIRAQARSINIRKSTNRAHLKHHPLITRVSTSESDHLGDSISINGCCLTIVQIDHEGWTFEASHETLEITTLSFLKRGDLVNVERAMLPKTRFGGHFVSGHVDCRGLIQKVKEAKDGWVVAVQVPKPFNRFCIPKGSITVDGVSLTINRVEEQDGDVFAIELCLIPATLQVTNLKNLHQGKYVNIEVDQLVKAFDRLRTTI